MRIRLGIAAALAAVLPLPGHAASEADLQEGRRLYLGHCAHCHGPAGEGGRGVNLTTGFYRYGSTERDLFLTIRGGIPGTEMPGSRLPDAEVTKIAQYADSLGRSGGLERPTGNPRTGEQIYRTKGGCTACHAIAGRGGVLGPELDGIGMRRSLQFLRESLLQPEVAIGEAYRTVTVVTPAGEEITGIHLNDDDYSIQLRDLQENLQSFWKSELLEWREPARSLMPSYDGVLSPREIEDLLAYLSTLRKAR